MSALQQIEVDPSVVSSDGDSSGYLTDTTTLSSSINEYIFENGRRYHAYYGSNKNLQPTDEAEQSRLDLHHEILLEVLSGNLHKAPLRSPKRILDIGTGTGLWAIEMADLYPSAHVIGVDLSPIQPNWVPPNCDFVVGDAELDWTYEPGTFDFVHARNVAQGIEDFPKLLAQAFRSTKSGGYVELAELGLKIFCDDETLRADNGVKTWSDTLVRAMEKIGRPSPTTEGLKKALETAGFVDVHALVYKQPIGPWPKEPRLKRIGAMNVLSADTGFHAYGMAAFTRVLGLSSEEADQICKGGIKSARDKNSHIYSLFHVVYGRKP